ncbi:MAG: 50S ribosomal protein L10 [Prolixibacteraceae bacterium]|nr:50S ribosomal protein L10 [Prolixibacteraceae bacterium]MBN2773344.1 50S ribosomal protein L10 [Prolixibacteraceae bacterium]
MKRSEKDAIINSLTEQINSTNHFYLADISDLNASVTSDLRRTCFKQDVKLVVAKNTLLRKALENSDKDVQELYDVLKGNTSVMFTEAANVPAKLIKDFSKKYERPILKGAYVEESVYVGADQLETLIAVKSKNELIADLVALLQSPIKTVVSQLQSGGNILHGVLTTLGEKE